MVFQANEMFVNFMEIKIMNRLLRSKYEYFQVTQYFTITKSKK